MLPGRVTFTLGLIRIRWWGWVLYTREWVK
jgi:hypothetical protein